MLSNRECSCVGGEKNIGVSLCEGMFAHGQRFTFLTILNDVGMSGRVGLCRRRKKSIAKLICYSLLEEKGNGSWRVIEGYSIVVIRSGQVNK